MERKKIYLSGPITGTADYKEKFAAAEKAFADKYDVVNPVDIGRWMKGFCRIMDAKKPKWSDYMRWDIAALVECDVIVMLEGWENSKGARLERLIAENLGMTIIEFEKKE